MDILQLKDETHLIIDVSSGKKIVVSVETETTIAMISHISELRIMPSSTQPPGGVVTSAGTLRRDYSGDVETSEDRYHHKARQTCARTAARTPVWLFSLEITSTCVRSQYQYTRSRESNYNSSPANLCEWTCIAQRDTCRLLDQSMPQPSTTAAIAAVT